MKTNTKTQLLLIAYALSGVAALVYQLGWIRELSTMLGATAYASGIMLGAYMTGLGLGAVIGTVLARKELRHLLLASRVELTIAAFSIVAFLGIRYLPSLYFDWMRTVGAQSPTGFLSLQFATCFLVMILPTCAMGMTYPLIVRAVGRDETIGAVSAKLYAVNTAGAILGALLATFAFLPAVGVKGALLLAAVFSVAAAWLFRALASKEVNLLSFFKSPDMAVALVIVAIIAVIPPRTTSPLGLGQVFYYRNAAAFEELAGQREILYDQEGIYSRVQVVRNPNGTRTLINGALDEGTDNDFDRVTTAMIAAVPAMSVEASSSALVVGLGTGYTSQTYYDMGFDKTTTIEINPEVLPASYFFIDWDSIAQERWHVEVDDARAYILTSPDMYVCISSEPSWPWSSGVAALFTQEFMQAARSHLELDGVYCQWLPNYLLNFEDVEMMYKTMRQVFERVDVWAINFPGDDAAELLMVGYNDPNGLSQDVVKRRLDELIEVGYFDNEFITPERITPYAEATRLEQAVSDPSVPLNTDNHSRLEYRVFWNFVERAFAPRAVTWGDNNE
ncbi:MAG: hypothetical protein FWG78_00710 [Coriobacteriia bacterium]|nr:hypothetical protein [Coriobacteriia bacterium]